MTTPGGYGAPPGGYGPPGGGLGGAQQSGYGHHGSGSPQPQQYGYGQPPEGYGQPAHGYGVPQQSAQQPPPTPPKANVALRVLGVFALVGGVGAAMAAVVVQGDLTRAEARYASYV